MEDTDQSEDKEDMVESSAETKSRDLGHDKK